MKKTTKKRPTARKAGTKQPAARTATPRKPPAEYEPKPPHTLGWAPFRYPPK
jgi:hypothetical protein